MGARAARLLRRAAGAGFAIGLLALSSASMADVVARAPRSCPRGAHPRSSHSGSFCRPTECTDATSCVAYYGPRALDGEVSCAPRVGLCIERSRRPAGGMLGGRREITVEIAHGSCSSDAQCGRARCEIARRCVPRAPSRAR